jgi:hypothetical protein
MFTHSLKPDRLDFVCSIYVIDWETLTVKFLDDNEYQTAAINNKIIESEIAVEKWNAYLIENAEIKRQNEVIEAKNAQAKAERTAKCICCHGTGQKEVKGMYMGLKTYIVTPINGLGISHEETRATYGDSTYTTCDCCR